MKYKGYILLAVTILMFSTLEVVTGTLKNLINPLQLTFLRFFIGGVVMLPLVIKKREKVQAKDLLFFLALGILNIFISMGSLQYAITMGKASTAAILISSNPIFVMLFSSIILKEKVTYNRVVCMLLFHIPEGTIIRILYVGVFVSGIAYVTYMEALKILTASKGAMVFF